MKRQGEDLNQKQGKKVSTEGYLSKLESTYEEIDKLLGIDVDTNETQMSTADQEKRIEEKLKECIAIGDLDKALAIIHYSKNIVEIPVNETSLRNEENEGSIANVAYKNGMGENYENFLNACETLGYIGENYDFSSTI